MERIDFCAKKQALNDEMMDAIHELLTYFEDGMVDFTSYDPNTFDTPYVVHSWDGCDSTEEIVVQKIWSNKGVLLYQDYELEWRDLARYCLFCCVDCVYDALADILSNWEKENGKPISELNHKLTSSDFKHQTND